MHANRGGALDPLARRRVTWIDAEGVASRLPVELGLREGGVVEVVSGLRAGVSVVTAGAHKVSEGAKVQATAEPLVGRAPGAPTEGSPPGEGT